MEQRKTRRFTLELPVALTRAGTQRLTETGHTKNISSCGVYFTANRELEIGGSIEYVITLISESPHAVNLRCMGKVVRCERISNGIAATVERYEFIRSPAPRPPESS